MSDRISYGCSLMTWQRALRASITVKALHGQRPRSCGNHRKLSHFLTQFHIGCFWMTKKNVLNYFIIKHLHEVPGWRNWQTQRTQNPPVLGTLGVQLPLPAPL